MCKIAVLTNVKTLDVSKVANKVGKILIDLEGDGFGYAVSGVNGVFGEKCIDDAFKTRIGKKQFNPLNCIKQKYEAFGNKSKPIGSIILHGRTSTNDIGLNNCHPMIRNEHYLIHNGVVTDLGPDYEKTTTNDSEDVLHRFIEGIKSVEQNLSGYYAFACIMPDGKLHIVKDCTARLYMAWAPKLDSFIIATTKSLIKDIAETLDAKIEAIDEINDDVHIIYNGNIMESCTAIKSLGYGEKESKHASRSLGFSLDDSDSEYMKDYDTFDYPEDAESDIMDEISELEYEREIENLDPDCEIISKDNRVLDLNDFNKLDPIAKRECTIVKSDGTWLEYFNYNKAA